MARVGRAHPNRPIIVRHPRMFDRHISLEAFELPIEWPDLTVTTPDARVSLDAFELPIEWPALTLSYDQTVFLGAFEVPIEWPELFVSVPVQPGDNIDRPGQIDWNGFLLGSTTSYRWLNLVGWRDRPPIDSGNVPRASRHGSWAGRPLSQERTITWTAHLQAPREDIEAAIDALEQAMPVLEDDTELPLAIRDLDTTYLVMGRIDRMSLPVEGRLRIGLGQLVLQWVCSDPRRYGIRRSGITIPANATRQLINAGNASTHPIIRVTGPVSNPAFTNQDLERLVTFAVDVDPGERLEINCDQGNATIDGVSIMGNLTGSSVHPSDWVLGRGAQDVTFGVDSGGTTGADLLWRDAWL